MTPSESGKRVDLYGASYRNFAHDLYAGIRREAFGEDIGQTSWLTADEQDLFLSWLDLAKSSRLLDVACGSGKPTLRIAQKTGCHVSGVDIHADGIAGATANAREIGYEGRAHFHHADAAERLSFDAASFDAVTCIDAVNHLPDRLAVLADWHRVLKPGGALLFTDPIVLTGPMTNEEIAIRASIGLFVFVPRGLDETLLRQVGFDIERVEDRTANMARNAAGWHAARAGREAELRKIEGDDGYSGQQRFLETAARLAGERRLSRFAILARKRQGGI
ncbi:MAG: class I SAM-dependent methyltransferase [Parvibaculaceae bacterium]